MNREQAELLMNRAIDGLASAAEREQLARMLRGNPLLRTEFEDMQATHASTESLFRQLALPVDFSARVMRRVQGVEVPSDTSLENVRLPEQRAHNGRLLATAGPARRTVRIYAIIAAVSAAAAVMLAVGVFSGAFARAGIGTQSSTESSTDGKAVAEGRRGVPDRGEFNRTDSPTPQPLGSNGAQQPDGSARQPEGSSVTGPETNGNESTPLPLPPKRVVKDTPTPPAPEEVQPEPEPEDVVEQPKTEPEQPKETVEQPQPENHEGGKTVAEPARRDPVGKLLIMSGRAELMNADGSVTRLQDKDQQIFSGDRIRTRYGAVVLLQLPGGDVTLGKDTQVKLDSDSSLTLEQYDGSDKGQLSLDRGHGHAGSSIAVSCEDYSLYVMSGTTVVERKRRGLSVAKASGFSTVTHETFGSLLLDESSGYESDIEFGKEFSQPKAKRVSLPDWSSEARSQAVMLALDPDIQARKFSLAAERSYVQNKLPGKLEKLLEHPACTDCVVTWLRTAIRNEKLEGAAIVKMVSEVEIAYFDVSELAPDVINGHADRAAQVAESFDQWREYFYRLMRPPVEPKNPNQPGQPQPAQPVPP